MRSDLSFDQWLEAKDPEVLRRLYSSGLKGLIRSAYARGLYRGGLKAQEVTKTQIKEFIDTLSEADFIRRCK